MKSAVLLALCAAILLINGAASFGLWAWDARHAKVDPKSKSMMVDFMAHAIKDKYPNLDIGDWAVSVVHAKDGDPEYSVDIANKAGGWDCTDETVKIPLGTKPEHSSDGSLVIIDTTKNPHRETDLYQAVYDPQTRRIVSAQQGYSLNYGANGPSGANAAGFATSHGLLTCDMFLHGRIETTMIWESSAADSNAAPRYPALANHLTPDTEISGFASGTWMRLNPKVRVNKIKGLKKWERIVARGLQTHGMVLRDTGGTFTIDGQNSINRGNTPWTRCGFHGNSIAFSANFPWHKMEVLRPPSEPANPVAANPAKCIRSR